MLIFALSGPRGVSEPAFGFVISTLLGSKGPIAKVAAFAVFPSARTGCLKEKTILGDFSPTSPSRIPEGFAWSLVEHTNKRCGIKLSVL
eukprot:2035568-Pyramimonas_sp.AAC.1